MRSIKLVFLLVVAVGLIILAVANRQAVSLNLLPTDLGLGAGLSVELPLFAVILAAWALGICIGVIMELLRERKYHRKAAERRRELGETRAQLERLQKTEAAELAAR